MSEFRCKMCGAPLDIESGARIATCDYCGIKQTVSYYDDDIVNNLHCKANDLRMQCDFDRAEQTYEKILELHYQDADAHWGAVLCRYGIEYVKDPRTGSRLPTCHRASLKPITSDHDYNCALQFATEEQKVLITAEAAAIDQILKNTLAIAKK